LVIATECRQAHSKPSPFQSKEFGVPYRVVINLPTNSRTVAEQVAETIRHLYEPVNLSFTVEIEEVAE
jgi:hypothetical protein